MEKDDTIKERTKDRIRGSLMAGAAGDALGYAVEFMSRDTIIDHYGSKGITKFELSHDGKALVSDVTQMTLFSANGMLMGLTRGYTRGVGGNPEGYVDFAYSDWYCLQAGKKKQSPSSDDFHYTWLYTLPQLAHKRQLGSACMSACESLFYGKDVKISKGSRGIVRVSPLALLFAGYWSRGEKPYDESRMDKAG